MEGLGKSDAIGGIHGKSKETVHTNEIITLAKCAALNVCLVVQ